MIGFDNSDASLSEESKDKDLLHRRKVLRRILQKAMKHLKNRSDDGEKTRRSWISVMFNDVPSSNMDLLWRLRVWNNKGWNSEWKTWMGIKEGLKLRPWKNCMLINLLRRGCWKNSSRKCRKKLKRLKMHRTKLEAVLCCPDLLLGHSYFKFPPWQLHQHSEDWRKNSVAPFSCKVIILQI